MTLPPLLGHEDHARAVARAHLRDRLPPVLLIHGPPGVGKQRFGLWMGQLLLCESPGEEGPCGRCRHCALARRLEHPDLHWYFPLDKPASRGSRERQDDALEELRMARLAERREEPLYPTLGSEGQGLHLGTIRNLRRRATQGPAMAARAFFLIGNAEELAVQDVRAESANALLKLLEEPPRGLRFVLTSSEPGRVLPTIRSRAASLHLPAIPGEAVARFLEQEAGADPVEAGKAAVLSGGAPGRALGFLPVGDEDGPLQKTRRDALRLVQAALDEAPSAPYRRAVEMNAFGARGLQELLGFVEMWLRDLGRAASSPGEEVDLLNQDVADWIHRLARERGIHPLGTARALRWVQEAREHAAGNVNPQLIVFGLLANLRRELRPASTSAPTGS